ncbi:DNA topoisomerase IB large subunit [Perkinsela sp. CCAP 1560/4]|nr:DNA topoisomerase IB large subunit [Perkinsela sp. CCAP 1560/4]|eukprot:KNH07280.1 DNA topoisomerase IB large subunit [Perkinsela sp. CCAP 1560/4]
MGEPAGSSQPENEMYKFWEASEDVPLGLLGNRNEIKWSTLAHNGVLFPPEYEPHGIPILYDGTPFAMTAEEEEVATMFAVMRKFEYYTNRVFRKNFFREWTNILNKRPENPIKDLNRCNFDAIYSHFESKRVERLAKTREEKKAAKEEKDRQELPYKYCIWDGRKELVGNFRVEPPGLFRGRGQHPRMGCLKTRIRPADVIINCGRDSVVPSPPAGHQWKDVVHNQNVVWLACWRDPISGTMKAVFPSVLSSVRACADQVKYEKARSLSGMISSIREAYTADFGSTDKEIQQRAVCMYFIDKLALRVGGDKELDAEADTVGCTSLRVEHIKLHPPQSMELDFLGKDSIRYVNTIPVLPRVFSLLSSFIEGKAPTGDLFDRMNPSKINKYLKSFMDGLTAKVFRTFNASQCLDEEVWENNVCSEEMSIAEKVAYFNAANTKVAVLCNHQRTTVEANFEQKMASLDEKEENLRQDVERLERYQTLWKKASTDAKKRDIIKQWNAEEDKIQLNWLANYGLPAEKAQYKKEVKQRLATVPRLPTAKKTTAPKSKGAVKKKSKSPKTSQRKAPQKKHTRGKATAQMKAAKVSKPATPSSNASNKKTAVDSKKPAGKIVVKRKTPKTNKPTPAKKRTSTSQTGRIQIKRRKHG